MLEQNRNKEGNNTEVCEWECEQSRGSCSDAGLVSASAQFCSSVPAFQAIVDCMGPNANWQIYFTFFCVLWMIFKILALASIS